MSMISTQPLPVGGEPSANYFILCNREEYVSISSIPFRMSALKSELRQEYGGALDLVQ